jgi:hypothetical protein
MSKKRLVRPMKIRRVSVRDIKHLYSTSGIVKKVPSAAYEDCVLVPLHLASFIPESAIRKFAANKPFVVEVNSLAENRLSFYGRHRNLLPLKNVYRITFDPCPSKSKNGGS